MFSRRSAYTWTISGEGACWVLKGNIEERACELAAYIVENRTTVREAAKKFGISKSTVHKDIQERLPLYNRSLYLRVKGVVEEKRAGPHTGGGTPPGGKSRGDPGARRRQTPPRAGLPGGRAGEMTPLPRRRSLGTFEKGTSPAGKAPDREQGLRGQPGRRRSAAMYTLSRPVCPSCAIPQSRRFAPCWTPCAVRPSCWRS